MHVVAAFANQAEHDRSYNGQTHNAADRTTGNSSNCDSID